MKKFIYIFLINFIFIQNVFSYNNPFWEKKDKHIYKIHKFIPNYLIFNASTTFDKTRGIYLGLFYELTCLLNFSDSLMIYSKLCLGENIPSNKITDFGTYYRPLKYLSFDIEYKFRNFSQYKIAEHCILLKMNGMLNFIKYLTATITIGFNLRFVDLNILDYKTTYKKDWLFNSSFIWKILIMIHPMYIFSSGISIGNIPDYEIYSFNYWQVEFINYIHISRELSVFLNGGFGFAGSLPMAGIINKGWIRLGVRYEIKTY